MVVLLVRLKGLLVPVTVTEYLPVGVPFGTAIWRLVELVH
jgi:hypothetical protein